MPTVQKHGDLRGKVTSLLVGNAKPGSVRAHLANSMVDVIDMTPLGQRSIPTRLCAPPRTIITARLLWLVLGPRWRCFCRDRKGGQAES